MILREVIRIVTDLALTYLNMTTSTVESDSSVIVVGNDLQRQHVMVIVPGALCQQDKANVRHVHDPFCDPVERTTEMP